MMPFLFSTDIIPVFLAVAAIGILGFVVFYNNPKSITNKTLLLFSLATVFWNICNYLTYQLLPPILAIWMLRMLIFFAVWQSFYLFQFFYVFPKDKILFPNWFKYGLFPSVFFTAVLTLTPLVFTRVIEYSLEGKIQKVANGVGIVIFGFVAVGLIIGSIYLLLKNLRNVKGVSRTQLQFILLGTVITFFLYIVFNFILPAFFNNPDFIAYGALFTLPFVGSTTYVIIKHRFLDIRLVVVRSVTYLLLLFILASIYAGGLFIIGTLVFKTPTNSGNLITSTILALIIAFSFQPLRRFLEKTTERVFYKGSYNSRILLDNLSHVMASTLDLSLLSESILKELLSQMKISFAFLILTRNHSITWVKGAGDTIPSPEFNEEKVCNLIYWIVKKPGENSAVFEELEEGEQKSVMREHNLSIILPLIVKDEVIGAILLGEKSSGDIYTAEDIEVLNILAPEISVAIKNSLSYEEIKRFNITLKEEVDQATEDLRSANDRLKELDKLKDEFVSLASHELRTPMTVIKSYVWVLLQQDVGKLNDKQKEYLERTYSSTERLIKLVNDMLNVSRIESGRMSIDKENIDITKLAKDVVEEMLPKAQEEGITLKIEDNKKIPEVYADPSRIKEVLINLIGNSLKFTPPRGKIEINVQEKDGMVQISVLDTGKGILKEDMPKLFQKFGTLGNNYLVKQNTQGTGLGLYISKSIVELNDGQMWADSDGEDKGTTFYFTLKKAKEIN